MSGVEINVGFSLELLCRDDGDAVVGRNVRGIAYRYRMFPRATCLNDGRYWQNVVER